MVGVKERGNNIQSTFSASHSKSRIGTFIFGGVLVAALATAGFAQAPSTPSAPSANSAIISTSSTNTKEVSNLKREKQQQIEYFLVNEGLNKVNILFLTTVDDIGRWKEALDKYFAERSSHTINITVSSPKGREEGLNGEKLIYYNVTMEKVAKKATENAAISVILPTALNPVGIAIPPITIPPIANPVPIPAQPQVKPGTKAEPKPEVKTETKTETKSETKPVMKTEVKPETKPEIKLETKLVAKPEAKPEAKIEVKPEAKPVEKKPEEKVKIVPIKAEPIKTEPIKTAPIKTEQVKIEPIIKEVKVSSETAKKEEPKMASIGEKKDSKSPASAPIPNGMQRVHVGHGIVENKCAIDLKTLSVPYGKVPAKASLKVLDGISEQEASIEIVGGETKEIKVGSKIITITSSNVVAGLTPLDSYADLKVAVGEAKAEEKKAPAQYELTYGEVAARFDSIYRDNYKKDNSYEIFKVLADFMRKNPSKEPEIMNVIIEVDTYMGAQFQASSIYNGPAEAATLKQMIEQIPEIGPIQ
jgi:hypothetical protein